MLRTSVVYKWWQRLEAALICELSFFGDGGSSNKDDHCTRMSGKPLLGLWLYRSGEEWNYKEDVPLTNSPVSKTSVSINF